MYIYKFVSSFRKKEVKEMTKTVMFLTYVCIIRSRSENTKMNECRFIVLIAIMIKFRK